MFLAAGTRRASASSCAASARSSGSGRRHAQHRVGLLRKYRRQSSACIHPHVIEGCRTGRQQCVVMPRTNDQESSTSGKQWQHKRRNSEEEEEEVLDAAEEAANLQPPPVPSRLAHSLPSSPTPLISFSHSIPTSLYQPLLDPKPQASALCNLPLLVPSPFLPLVGTYHSLHCTCEVPRFTRRLSPCRGGGGGRDQFVCCQAPWGKLSGTPSMGQ